MSRFVGNLDLRVYEPGEWVLLQHFGYRTRIGSPFSVSGSGPKGHTVMAPRGFITDLASIPRIFRGFISQTGKSRYAAVIHDYLYCDQATTRADADAIFLEALEASGVGWIQRKAMYAAVRAGGWIYWNKRAQDKLNQQYDFVPNEYWDDTGEIAA